MASKNTKRVHVRIYEDDMDYIKIHYPVKGGIANFVRDAVAEKVKRDRKVKV